eukprot:SM001872S03959  [mRNA]  locus=s1872:868:1857:- [translate_table: standard]
MSQQHLALPRGAEAAEACAEQVEAVAAEPAATGHIPRLTALTLQLDLPCDPAEASQQPAASATSGASVAAAPHQELTVGERERLLDELVGDGWLAAPTAGAVGLGARAFVELGRYLRGLDGVPTCETCGDAAIQLKPDFASKARSCGDGTHATPTARAAAHSFPIATACAATAGVLQATVCECPGCGARIHAYCVPRKFYRTTVSASPISLLPSYCRNPLPLSLSRPTSQALIVLPCWWQDWWRQAERPCPQCGAEWPRVEEARSASEEAGIGPSPLGPDSQECTAGSRRGTASLRGAAAKAKRQRGD